MRQTSRSSPSRLSRRPPGRRGAAEHARKARQARLASKQAPSGGNQAGTETDARSAQPALTPAQEAAVASILRRGLNCSYTSMAASTGADEEFLKKVCPVASHLIMDAHADEFASLVEAVAKDREAGCCRALLFAQLRSFDEASRKARALEAQHDTAQAVTWESSTHAKNWERAVVKIMAGFREFRMLLAYRTGGLVTSTCQLPHGQVATGQLPCGQVADVQPRGREGAEEGEGEGRIQATNVEYALIRGSFPTILHTMSKQKAPVVLEVLQRLRRMRATTLALINQTFERKVQLTLADSHPSNIKAERADAQLEKTSGWKHTSFRCRMHRIDTCEKKSDWCLGSIRKGNG